MIGIFLKVILPYVLMFLASYLATGLVWRVKVKRHGYPPEPEKERQRDKMGVMDKILIIEAVAIVLYVIADFIVFWHIGAEPSTLTVSFFGVCGGENGFMAWIKTRKETERMRKWQKEDEDKADSYEEDKGL